MFSLEILRKLAKLSRINLTESEEKTLTDILEKTTFYMDMLGELNTDNVEPTYQTSGVENKFQSENLCKTLETEEVLQNATSTKNNLIVSKAVFDRN